MTTELSAELNHPALDAVLATAATLLGMEVAFLGGITEDTFTIERLYGRWEDVEAGTSFPVADSLCHRMLGGAPNSTSDAAADPHYSDAPARGAFGITSYVGVPVRDHSGTVVATLCGIDHRSVPVAESTVSILTELAQVVAAHLGPLITDRTVIRRTPAGWEVGGETTGELSSAMVLADLLADELSPGARPPRSDAPLDELARLRLSVTQLEHALAARVLVEQAIGVLSERQHASPRDSFERLRRVARSRGRRVHDLAREVVGSVTDPATPLPPELAGRR